MISSYYVAISPIADDDKQQQLKLNIEIFSSAQPLLAAFETNDTPRLPGAWPGARRSLERCSDLRELATHKAHRKLRLQFESAININTRR